MRGMDHSTLIDVGATDAGEAPVLDPSLDG
jgi:hypothetical protein